ncbi:hypothetical protein ABFA07_020635 [Porites harrisoni]
MELPAVLNKEEKLYLAPLNYRSTGKTKNRISMQHSLVTIQWKCLLMVKASERTVIGETPPPTLYQETLEFFL